MCQYLNTNTAMSAKCGDYGKPPHCMLRVKGGAPAVDVLAANDDIEYKGA